MISLKTDSSNRDADRSECAVVSRRGRFWVGVFLLALALAMLAEDVGWAQPGGTPPDRTPPMDEGLDGWGEMSDG